ncbi:MAG: hypothetical protein A3C93_05280 [Candidatus Lloydbacteria bacterium RIFCSPHIGHO2_02_FULL_54_17]|uniref:Putative gamma-glutamylcyclotransferase n=1 Tax=Candidatus Lloydbacteria bacterium RIFCSPHIGHO2_02_FULL_54_17 TaxID=1798664 RepID=A0A1G2DCI4_9BACT|nr:MAG: hypothetical protein A2762_00645 [Candidatus Lloydbacteria bacterium RIFCSPHIGHO2_01_FULL_54_11]OGZ11349.1 MAG: hypothetical protein A3C93_05280 [Candidatus Lloydbacteria bacterium RIFCSPHIGHO2_02_FULL_54_17]OGZ13811.1 MAG: hypothetical protein A2948_03915 [Candidatus Lloydbacteria bacterium RIFCSPLOWO2_01_FULL_54_18]OGZ15554.1 MAG: hypothetical protein A3H76_01910 [Candidatus Lloydbacteria bacterium RIFCSPLOWO2_02_FULL_54_12]
MFIYGTLADPKIQRSVWGRETTGVPDVLREYRRSEIEIDGEIYPLIIPSKEGHVEGLVIEVADDELEKIDDYETDAYERVEVILESGAIAWVYVRG